MLLLLLLSTIALVASDVSHLPKEDEYESQPPPKPYAFTYTAGRYPGHADRQHTEVSDGSGVIRGQYSYIDPRQKIRTVQYVADKQGFHPILNDAPPDHPKDTEAVEQAKSRHYNLYNTIAEEHQQHPYPEEAKSERGARSIGPGAIVAATAYVHRTATLESGCIVKDYAQVWDHAFVGSGAILEAHTIVGRYASVGRGAIMMERSRLLDHSRLASGQILPAGAVR